MNTRIANVIKKFLPEAIIQKIKTWKKSQRQKRRFALNEGKDIRKHIALEQSSFEIYLNPYLNGGVDDDIYRNGTWEPEIVTLIKKYLPSDGTFVDIGANIGFHSLLAASLVGENGQVLAFEPLPRLQRQMQKSVKENNYTQVTLEPVALGQSAGTAVLSLVEENIGASSLQDVATDRAVGEKVTVPVRTLDSYADKFDQLDLIKIDIEGSEYEALKGGEAVLRAFKPVIILEFSPHVYEKDFVGKSLALYEYLIGLGYTISDIEKRVPDIKSSLGSGRLTELHTNLLCLPS